MWNVNLKNPEGIGIMVVDVQNTFIKEEDWGTWELWVENWWAIVPRVNDYMREIKQKGGLVLASRDYHPKGHISFASSFKWKENFSEITWDEVKEWTQKNNWISETATFSLEDLKSYLEETKVQKLWPDHAVAWDESSDFHRKIDLSCIDTQIIKGFENHIDSYSAFQWREEKDNDISMLNPKTEEVLRNSNVRALYIVWIATDVCVMDTAMDANELRKAWELDRVIVLEDAVAWVDEEWSKKALEKMREAWIEIAKKVA